MKFYRVILIFLASVVLALPLMGKPDASAGKSHHSTIKASHTHAAGFITGDAEVKETTEETEFENLFIPLLVFTLLFAAYPVIRIGVYNLRSASATASSCPRYLRIGRLTI